MEEKYFTVVEVAAYGKKAQKLLTEGQMEDIANIVALNPEIGEVLKGGGGVRKFRYAAREGRGKSGGARVIYLAVIRKEFVYLLDIFGKNEKINLSRSEINAFAAVAKQLKGEEP